MIQDNVATGLSPMMASKGFQPAFNLFETWKCGENRSNVFEMLWYRSRIDLGLMAYDSYDFTKWKRS